MKLQNAHFFSPPYKEHSTEGKKMIVASTETPRIEIQNMTDKYAREYAERLVISLGYNDAIITAMEFQWFHVAEELRFMQDDYRGV